MLATPADGKAITWRGGRFTDREIVTVILAFQAGRHPKLDDFEKDALIKWLEDNPHWLRCEEWAELLWWLAPRKYRSKPVPDRPRKEAELRRQEQRLLA